MNNFEEYKLDLDSILRQYLHDTSEDLDLTNVVDVCIFLMQSLARKLKLSGEKKKFILLSVLKEFVFEQEDMNKVLQRELYDFCEYLLPTMIDALVQARKKKFTFKMKSKTRSLLCIQK